MTAVIHTISGFTRPLTVALAGAVTLLWQVCCVAGEDTRATSASLDQSKPPCILETTHLQQPGGFDPVKVEYAYPDYRRAPGESNYPASIGVVLDPRVKRDRGPAMLVSIESVLPDDVYPAFPDRAVPAIVATNDPPGEYSRPIIQIHCLCNRELKDVSYDLRHPSDEHKNLTGYINEAIFDPKHWKEVGTAFACLDVELAPGTNTVTLHCKGWGGQMLTTNLTYILNLERDHAAPRFSVTWPTNGQSVSGDVISIRGQVDDNNAIMRARVIGGGKTNILTGLTERSGRFWIERLSLTGISNEVSLAAIDPAGNVATSDLVILRSRTRLTIDPVPERQLYQLRVQVTGSVNPPDQEVWVNGKQAVVSPDGKWVAKRVPVTEGGVGIFEAIAIPRKTAATSTLPPEEVVSIQAKMPAQPMTLNLSQPACGIFQLHIEGAEGRPFVLSTSSNLLDWTPILTNRSASPFSYSDTNAAAYGCKFFRVIPAE